MDNSQKWPRVIVIEGNPQVGKTTMANFTAESLAIFGRPIGRIAGPVKFDVQSMVHLLTSELQDSTIHIIDGFHLTSLMKIDRLPPRFIHAINEIEMTLDQIGAIKFMVKAAPNREISWDEPTIKRCASIEAALDELQSANWAFRIRPYMSWTISTQADYVAAAAAVSIAYAKIDLEYYVNLSDSVVE